MHGPRKKEEKKQNSVTLFNTHSFSRIIVAANKVFPVTINPDGMFVVCEFMNKCFVLMFK
jgi:hypothetical protein